MDGPRWLGWLTVAALALLFAALYAFTRLRPTPQTGGVDANRFLLWGLGALALAGLLLLLIAQGVGRPQRRLARAVQGRPPMFATPWRARRRRSPWRSWLLLLLTLAALAALAPPGCPPLLAQRRRLARVLHRPGGMSTPPSAWALGWVVLGALTAGALAAVQALQRAAGRPQCILREAHR